MELAIPRAVFGGQMGDPAWRDLPTVPPLPPNVATDAAVVRAAIGVSWSTRPAVAVARLVQYFRGFADSSDEPTGHGNVYLDLALSKKGVCRHRAFAFMVTAQSLGIPARLVLNEAHAWVEIHDGTMWRRIDLGGAGHMTNAASSTLAERPAYRPPADAFPWPQSSERGDDMVADARSRGPSSSSPPSPSATSAADRSDASGAASASSLVQEGPGMPGDPTEPDDRPPATVMLSVVDSDPHRGSALHVRGDVHASGEACPHVPVEVWIRDARSRHLLLLGSLATDDAGMYSGGIVVPGTTPLGDYDVVARTPGDSRCGFGASN
jgi:hypothetical protein